jgi:hypothetical protein
VRSQFKERIKTLHCAIGVQVRDGISNSRLILADGGAAHVLGRKPKARPALETPAVTDDQKILTFANTGSLKAVNLTGISMTWSPRLH